MDTIFSDPGIALAIVCWAVIFCGAVAAVFSPAINDTLLERCFLGLLALAAVGKAWRLYVFGWVTEGDQFLAVVGAGYVLSIFWKHRPARWRRKA